ncbi:MAG: hypothetical protein JXX28_01325 [Deltaproteobacteria bacterium]|nr:hypothetical protein [Deltaproteobacteria bacterium]
MLLALLLACASPLEVSGTVVAGGVEVVLRGPADQVEVLGPQGEVLAARRGGQGLDALWIDVPVDWERASAVRATRGEAQVTSALAPLALWGGVDVALQLPLGQPLAWRPGEGIALRPVDGLPVPLGLQLTAVHPAEITVGAGQVRERVALPVAGQRRLIPLSLGAGDSLWLEAGGARLEIPTTWSPVPRAEAAAKLAWIEGRFPADPRGLPETGRPEDRVTLPSRWWGALLRRVGLGERLSPELGPWAWEAVTLGNSGDQPLDLSLSASVLEPDGTPSRVFRPRLREADGQLSRVVSLLRVPPGGEATAVLPVYVDPRLAHQGTWIREVRVTPLGSAEPLLVHREPLYVSRGSAWLAGGLAVTLLGAALGLAWLGLGLRRWLRERSTSELMTVALFGTLAAVLTATSRLLLSGVGAALGPFSPLVVGLLDDVLRTALVATLLSLLPRRGVAALGVLVGWLVQLLLLGSFLPTDLIFVGARVAWLEGGLWLAGITRPTGWRDASPLGRWARLSLGLGVASVLSTGGGLVLHMTLFRLWFAPWYVAMVLLLPGFAYVLVGVALAVPFAESLRRVEG